MLCFCMGLSHEEIEEVVQEKNIQTFEVLQDETGVSTGCGKCYAIADDLFRKCLAQS